MNWIILMSNLNAGCSFADTKEGRYNPKMAPLVPVYNWRKGSQVMGHFQGMIASWGLHRHKCKKIHQASCGLSNSCILPFLFAVGGSDQKACRSCSEWHYCLSYVSTALQGNDALWPFCSREAAFVHDWCLS